jgi:hypothetical protein
MATLGPLALTYRDIMARTDPNGQVAQIIEILSQTNEILDVMVVKEGNLPTGHQTTQRTGLPSATWRLMNQGVQPAKSTTAQVTDSCGMLETYSDLDLALYELNGNSKDYRLSEDVAFMEGMNQQSAGGFIYSNSLMTPAQIMGLAPRYSTVSTLNANTANNVIDAGGTGSTNTSIYVMVWGDQYIHGIYPKGSVIGLEARDLGEQTLYTAIGSGQTQYQVLRTHFRWKLGLCVRDWRYCIRICNIDVTQLAGANAPNLINALIKAVHKLPTAPSDLSTEQRTDAPNGGQAFGGRTTILCNRTIRTYLDIQAVNKTNVLLRFEEWHGKPVTTFRQVPILTCDQILNTEARVV